jgi:hypothetical protein
MSDGTQRLAAEGNDARAPRGHRPTGDSTGWLTLFVVFAALTMTGCAHTTNFAVPNMVLGAIVAALKAKRGLQFQKGEKQPAGTKEKNDDEMFEDRHKGCFVYRRANAIGARHPDWVAEPSPYPTLSSHVEAQLAEVEAYLQGLTGPSGSLAGPFETRNGQSGQSTAAPSQAFTALPDFHLDLSNAAIQFTGTAPPKQLTPSDLQEAFVRKRINGARTIAWRAASLHDELWSDNGDGAALNKAALTAVLDRRLRSIERMDVQANSAPAFANGKLVKPPQPGRGPWIDQTRVRMYEYNGPFSGKLIDHNDSQKIWLVSGSGDSEIATYTLQEGQRVTTTRFNPEPTSPSPDWLLSSSELKPYVRVPDPNASPAALLDRLMVSSVDVWQRTWLFCDHCITSVHLEALRFSLLRNNPGTTFDSLFADPTTIRTFALGSLFNYDISFDSNQKPVVNPRPDLFQQGITDSTRYFDNLFIDFNDLQVGDHLILWNHHIYAFISKGAWRLENAFVQEVDVEPARGRVDWSQLRLTGFGASFHMPAFLDFMYTQMTKALDLLYKTVADAAKAGSQAFLYRGNGAFALVFSWEFFPGLSAPGLSDKPWFMFMSRNIPGDKGSPWPDVSAMASANSFTFVPPLAGAATPAGVNGLPTSIVADNIDPVSGKNNPTTLTLVDNTGAVAGVLFPLFLPLIPDMVDWVTFFAAHAVNPQLTGALIKTPIDGSHLPGLFLRGVPFPIQVIRPTVRT